MKTFFLIVYLTLIHSIPSFATSYEGEPNDTRGAYYAKLSNWKKENHKHTIEWDVFCYALTEELKKEQIITPGSDEDALYVFKQALNLTLKRALKKELKKLLNLDFPDESANQVLNLDDSNVHALRPLYELLGLNTNNFINIIRVLDIWSNTYLKDNMEKYTKIKLYFTNYKIPYVVSNHELFVALKNCEILPLYLYRKFRIKYNFMLEDKSNQDFAQLDARPPVSRTLDQVRLPATIGVLLAGALSIL